MMDKGVMVRNVFRRKSKFVSDLLSLFIHPWRWIHDCFETATMVSASLRWITHADPHLHQISPDVLTEEMVLNVVSGAYVEGPCALRHRDFVVCAVDGTVVLIDSRDAPRRAMPEIAPLSRLVKVELGNHLVLSASFLFHRLRESQKDMNEKFHAFRQQHEASWRPYGAWIAGSRANMVAGRQEWRWLRDFLKVKNLVHAGTGNCNGSLPSVGRSRGNSRSGIDRHWTRWFLFRRKSRLFISYIHRNFRHSVISTYQSMLAKPLPDS
jgi:hypothetical protein